MRIALLAFAFLLISSPSQAQFCVKTWEWSPTGEFCPRCEWTPTTTEYAWRGGGTVCMQCGNPCPRVVSDPTASLSANEEDSCGEPYRPRPGDVMGALTLDESVYSNLVEQAPAIAMMLTHFQPKLGEKFDVINMKRFYAVLLGKPTETRAWQAFHSSNWEQSDTGNSMDLIQIAVKGHASPFDGNSDDIRFIMHTYSISEPPLDNWELTRSVELRLRPTGNTFQTEGVSERVPVYRIVSSERLQ